MDHVSRRSFDSNKNEAFVAEAPQTDGASKGHPGMASSGGLSRDEFGRWLGGFAFHIGTSTAM